MMKQLSSATAAIVHLMKTGLNLIIVFSILIQAHHAQCMLDSLLESLASAQEYVRNDLLPLLSMGIRTIQQVEQFVDATIDEECVFQCPIKGQAPRARQDHVPSSNGCGSMDVLFDNSPESLIHVEPEFTHCCDEHDFCYDTCMADKDMCDLKFKKCLYSRCQTDKRSYLDEKACKLKAKMFYVAVVGVGCHSYIDAQKKACHCVSPSSPREEL